MKLVGIFAEILFCGVKIVRKRGEKSAKGRAFVCVCARGESEKRKKILAWLSKLFGWARKEEESGVRANVYVNFSFCTRTLAHTSGSRPWLERLGIKLLNLCEEV